MADTRSGRAKKNIVVSLACQVVTLLCGFVVPKLLLDAFGSEVYGASTSITQFLAYITLLEGGVGGVARAVLYKPLAENDHAAISSILSEMQRFFRVIACIFLVYVLILACSFKSLSGLEALDQLSTFLLVVIISMSTAGQYYIGISNSILLQAAQRSYVTNLINLLGTIVNTVATVVLVNAGCNILTVKLFSSCIFLLKPVAFWCYVRRLYRIRYVPKSNTVYLKQKWSGLGQHIAFFLHSNTDVVLLTCLASLKDVAVYAVYNMVISHMQSLAASFVSGMEALFGDMLAKGEHQLLRKTFDLYEMMISVVSMVMFASTAVLILPFVRLYTAGITDTDYYAPFFSLLLTSASLLYCLRMPYHAMVIAAGHFRSTNWAAYGEALINVVISALLVCYFGMVGVAVGTVLATMFRFAYYIIYLSKHIINRSICESAKRFLVNGLVFMAIYTAGKGMLSLTEIQNYLHWSLWSVGVVTVALLITLGTNLLFYRETLTAAIRKIFRRG